jgi:DTW domain-containing protein YfiP
MGQGFEQDESVQALLADSANHCVLLYPGREALNLTEAGTSAGSVSGAALHALRSQLNQRRLVVFLLDATWGGARKLLRLSPSLQRLPRIMFTPTRPSQFIIKQQPQEGCLSTLEAVHELLLVLEQSGLEHYPDSGQLMALFHRMQDYQIKCAADPTRPGYRRKPYGDPASRKLPRAARNYLKKPKGIL